VVQRLEVGAGGKREDVVNRLLAKFPNGIPADQDGECQDSCLSSVGCLTHGLATDIAKEKSHLSGYQTKVTPATTVTGLKSSHPCVQDALPPPEDTHNVPEPTKTFFKE
jgi:hypothetical protein